MTIDKGIKELILDAVRDCLDDRRELFDLLIANYNEEEDSVALALSLKTGDAQSKFYRITLSSIEEDECLLCELLARMEIQLEPYLRCNPFGS